MQDKPGDRTHEYFTYVPITTDLCTELRVSRKQKAILRLRR